MISFSNINKHYGKQLIFVDASFQLNPGEKVGLVGPNGSGKTTLFRMVVGEETPDEGAVSVPKKLTLGYFRQDVEEMQGRSVLDEAMAGADASAIYTTSSKPCSGKCPTPIRLMTWTAFLSASVTFRRSTSIWAVTRSNRKPVECSTVWDTVEGLSTLECRGNWGPPASLRKVAILRQRSDRFPVALAATHSAGLHLRVCRGNYRACRRTHAECRRGV